MLMWTTEYVSVVTVYILMTKLINSMEQGPWEANLFSASKEIPRIL